MLVQKRIEKNQEFCLGDVIIYGNNSVVVYEINEDTVSCTRTVFSVEMESIYVDEAIKSTHEELLKNLLEFDLNVHPVYINRNKLKNDSLNYCNCCGKGFKNPYSLNIPELVCDQCMLEIDKKAKK